MDHGSASHLLALGDLDTTLSLSPLPLKTGLVVPTMAKAVLRLSHLIYVRNPVKDLAPNGHSKAIGVYFISGV